VLLRTLLICVLTYACHALAAEVTGLFETQVIAGSQSSEDRNSAMQTALSIVLHRVAAGHDIAKDPSVRAALADAPRYVKQYQYALVESLWPASAGARSARTMRVLFDEPALINLLKSSNLKVWGETRPETLLWLVVEENSQRLFFKPETMPELDLAFKSLAKQQGLPLLYPLMDIDEQRQLSVQDVLSAYPQHLLSASERYGVVSILAGRVVKDKNCWQSDWAFYFDQRVEQWTHDCGSLNEVILMGLQGVYGKLSNYYAVKPFTVVEKKKVTLKISGILTSDDRDRVLRYLKSLTMVTSVDWLTGSAGQDIYKVGFDGNRTDLEDRLALGRILNPQDHENAGTDELNYRLLSKRF